MIINTCVLNKLRRISNVLGVKMKYIGIKYEFIIFEERHLTLIKSIYVDDLVWNRDYKLKLILNG